jgi:hypothetical protein
MQATKTKPQGTETTSTVQQMGSDLLPQFQAGDIILFAGRGDFLSNGVRWFERSRGEAPTYAVHSAQFLDPDRYLELALVEKIRATGELLKKRQAHDVWQRRGFEVWRCRSLTPEQREALTEQALAYVGERVAIAKFITHELDGLINKVVRREVFFFRRLNHDQRYPICSWVTAFTYKRVLNYQFGVPPECANPDQIDDWVSAHPDEWARVYRLEEYPAGYTN